MSESEQLSRLIGEIYDASLDPDRWDAVLGQTTTFLNSATATLGSFDLVHRNTNFNKSYGYDPAHLQLLMERYIKTNPMNFSGALAKTGDVHAIGDLLPYDEFYATAMYLEWGKPKGYIDAIQATLERTPTALAFLHCIRHESVGMVDGETRRRLGLLWPHFRRAVLIGKVIDLHKVEAAALADTLDGLSAAMFLVDGHSRVVHCNRPGHIMIEERAILKCDNGRLSVTDPQANLALDEIFAAASDGDQAVGTRGITVPLRSREQEQYVAHVLPLTSGARRQAGIAYSSVAAVFVRKRGFDGPSPVEALVNTYGLTPAELRVFLAIVEVGGVPEVAPILGISETTVKTHLQHVFEKTGTSRQADLVKLFAGFMSPLANAVAAEQSVTSPPA